MMINAHPNESAIRKERNSRRFWILLILGFFGMDVTIAVVAVVMASGDPSFRAIPGFGARAVSWDARKAMAESWKKQAWVDRVILVVPKRDAIELVLCSSSGEPITDLSGTIRVFHFTRVAEQQVAELKEVDPGVYKTQVDIARPGLWSVEFHVTTRDGTQCWSERTMNWGKSLSDSNMTVRFEP